MANGQHEDESGHVLVAFLAGAAVGAALALIFAPATGEDTRRAVTRRTRESRERIMDALRQGRGILGEQRQNVVTAFERARQQAQRGGGDPEPNA